MTPEDEGYGAWYALAALIVVIGVVTILGIVWGS